ncbi:Uu.00g019750.m01.CDS01 [Anthostomella pinea]|uniref:Uu.00g019750.m01.CDS01 n=1 Tax=Anthostomella pinea TaxID=933095 RepID=A0AAI8VTI1_9PEZI|nr:Uu.00g019750.m01.CDS01 [Anthostomella pinea]
MRDARRESQSKLAVDSILQKASVSILCISMSSYLLRKTLSSTSRLHQLSAHLSPNDLTMKTTEHKLSPPSLEDLAKAVTPALQKNYEDASVSVVDCPDLRQAPFHLAGKGLCGNECVADIGGQSHLFPRPLLDKIYPMLECAKGMHLALEGGMLIGAGAGPFHVIGMNSELAPNLSWSGGFENVDNKSRYAKVRSVTDGQADVVCQPSPSTDCALMMNLYGSAGQSGPVLRVTARSRRGDQKSFTECTRRALHDAYGDDKQVSLGGAFVIRKGKALFHVMPDFPAEPFTDRHELNEWLTFHEFPAPMVCLTVLHSADPQELGLRMEHTHCFSGAGRDEGGHYHNDLLPEGTGGEEIEYEAYFNTAKVLYRIDQPQTALDLLHH